MKSTFILTGLCCLFLLNSCGPASEDRQAMHARAKVFQDSIANVIKTSMDEAAAPGPNQAIRPDTSVKAAAPATATTK